MSRTLTILLLLVIAASASATEIALRESVVLSGSIVRLGDIASVSEGGGSGATRLADLPLMPAPAPGTTQTIRTQDLRSLLAAQGVELADLRFTGASQVTMGLSNNESRVIPDAMTRDNGNAPRVQRQQQTGYRLPTTPTTQTQKRAASRPTVTLTASRRRGLQGDLQKAVDAFVRAELDDPLVRVDGVELEPRHAVSLALAVGEPLITTTEQIELGKTRLLVSLHTREGEARFPVFGQVVRAEPMVVAKRNLARGDVVTAADVEIVARDASLRLGLNERLAGAIDEVIGKETARPLKPGQPLSDANCLPPVMVRRGEPVSIVSGGRGIRVRMRGVVRRDGRLGETVEVETDFDGDRRNRKRIEARVVGHGELAVLSGAANVREYR